MTVEHGSRLPLSVDEEMVGVLLRAQEVSPDKLANDGQTPLPCAVKGGLEEMVKILFRQGGTNCHESDISNYSRAPLLTITSHGHKRVVEYRY